MFYNDPCRIYDCSNSIERPSHRGGGGPIMNDIIKYLHENAEDYYFKFVDSPNDAEIILTNDVFPSNVLNLGIPLVKRMCGPFWQNNLVHRNDVLNTAAQQADHVIFISEYSKNQYLHCYGNNLKNYSVITHWVDYNVFKPLDKELVNKQFVFAACATNWNRKEKRLSALIEVAKRLPNISFLMIGTVEQELPDNIISMGYVSDPTELSYLLACSDGFINLSYRDAATKTIPQAISCGVPVLYANSGGVSEMVTNPIGDDFGIPILDNNILDSEDDVPDLDINNILSALQIYNSKYKNIRESLQTFDSKLKFIKMLDGYFNALSNLIRI